MLSDTLINNMNYELSYRIPDRTLEGRVCHEFLPDS
jgi:hypothetical protein